MIKNKKHKDFISPFIIILLIGLSVILIFNNSSLSANNSNLNKTNLVLKSVLKSDNLEREVYSTEQKANSYYEEAGFFYEKGDYKNVESNCRLARDYYSSASQGYLDILSKLKVLKLEDNLIKLEIQKFELASEIQMNMYEACEHFESASRYYDTYFNNEVLSSNFFFEMGGKEIDSMNEKIKLHDENVREYNRIISKIKIELNKLK